MFPVLPIPGTSFFIPSYFTVIALGYTLGIFWLQHRAIHREMPTHTAMDLALVIMAAGFIGSRLFHVIFEYPEIYQKDPIQILKFWQGGFVFYGGALLATLASLGLLKARGENLWEWADLLAPIIPFVYGIGRFATLLSGSGYGKPTDLPWGIVYPPGTEAPVGIALHPTPLYSILLEALTLFLVISVQIAQKKSPQKLQPGLSFGVLIICHGAFRALVEQFRDDFRGDTFLQLSISTWISFGLVGIGLIICFQKRRR